MTYDHGVVGKGCYDMLICMGDMVKFYKALIGIKPN